jgi:hypothetical protein
MALLKKESHINSCYHIVTGDYYIVIIHPPKTGRDEKTTSIFT